VQNGDWSGDFSDFTVDNCTITSASFTIQSNTEIETIAINKQSIPIVNNEVQFQHSFENGGNLANSQTNVEFSGTFTSPTEFKGTLQLPEGPVTIKASLPVPTATPAWFPPLTQWREGIPIMPGAIDGEMAGAYGGDPHGDGASYENEYDFHIKASSADIIAYYQQQMQTLGWNSGNESDLGDGSKEIDFSNGGKSVSFTIKPQSDDINEVGIIIH
jgi:hypothetical protein